MFFIMGVSQKEKKLDFDKLVICKCCNKYGHIEVFMSYWYFMFFFIPILKWNKSYFVKMNCCNNIAILDNEIGQNIEKGRQLSIDINKIDFKIYQNNMKYCSECGYTTNEEFNYCPNCSNKL